jgi:TonB-dependent receptor
MESSAMKSFLSLRGCVALLVTETVVGLSTAGIAAAAADSSGGPPAPGHALEEITITAQRTTVEEAREAQFEAPNLVDIATYEEIRKLPDLTVAEAVRRVPGISLETDEGEGRYVNIRGFDADLNSTTFGGLRLPPTNNASPFGGYRAVTLDSIPIGLVGALTVTKSNLPSQDAEALGGTIEITPKSAPTDGAPFLQGNLGSGYEPLRRTGIIDFAVTAGGRFGGPGRPSGSNVSAYSDRPFSIVATISYNENKRGIDDVEPAYFNDGVHPYQAINNIQQRDYELHRKRHGYGLDLGYQPDADDSYYLRAFDAGYTEGYLRQFLNVNPDGNTTAVGGVLTDTLAGGSAIQKAFRDEKETSRDQVFVAGGKNVFGENKLDYRVGYTKGSWNKAYDYNSAFNYVGPRSNPTISYTLTNPGNTPAYTITGASYLDPRNFLLAGFANSTAYNYDKELSFAANVQMPVRLGSFDVETLQLGVSARLRHKLTTSQPYSYPTLPNLLLSDASSGGNETYYASRYQNGVDIAPGYLQSLLGPGTIAPSDTTSSLQQYLDAKEDVYALYGQYQMTAGAFGLIGGARVEKTRDRANAYSAGVDAAGTPFANPVSASHSYTNFFPSIQARYQIQSDLLARATWSSTIARPGFNQANASLSIDLGAGIVTTGNPYLKPATANSFDLSIEKYLGAAGILSIGVFDKEIAHYIVANVLPNQTLPNVGLYPGNPLPLKVFTYTNAGASYARGIEFNWEQRFQDLPGLLAGLGVGANYTLVDSRFEIRPGEHSPLPSTSKNTWNASIFYEKDRLSVRLAAYSVSADLFGIGGDRTGDVFNGKRTSMDFGGSYTVTGKLVIYAEAKNLLNTPHVFYQGTPDRPIQREFYGQDYLIGLRFDF